MMAHIYKQNNLFGQNLLQLFGERNNMSRKVNTSLTRNPKYKFMLKSNH